MMINYQFKKTTLKEAMFPLVSAKVSIVTVVQQILYTVPTLFFLIWNTPHYVVLLSYRELIMNPF